MSNRSDMPFIFRGYGLFWLMWRIFQLWKLSIFLEFLLPKAREGLDLECQSSSDRFQGESGNLCNA
jgi:hypothetical protein